MARVALEYMARNGYLERPSRFDVVEVRVSESSPPAVRHIEDAFRLWRTG
jgi:Holliday junction resolvase-like predicted endonuclease